MAYEKQTFIDKVKDALGNVLVEGTKLKAEHLNHIEDGIVANEAAAQAAATAAAEAKEIAENAANTAGTKELPTVTESDDGKLLQVVGGKWSAVAITDGNNVAY